MHHHQHYDQQHVEPAIEFGEALSVSVEHARTYSTMMHVRAALQQKRAMRRAAPITAIPSISDYEDDEDDEDDEDRVDPRTLLRPPTPEPCEVERARDVSIAAMPAQSAKPGMRCGECASKLTGLQQLMPCRCGRRYCSSHRIDHSCQYMYRLGAL